MIEKRHPEASDGVMMIVPIMGYSHQAGIKLIRPIQKNIFGVAQGDLGQRMVKILTESLYPHLLSLSHPKTEQQTPPRPTAPYKLPNILRPRTRLMAATETPKAEQKTRPVLTTMNLRSKI